MSDGPRRPRTLRDVLFGPGLPREIEEATSPKYLRDIGNLVKPKWMDALDQVSKPTFFDKPGSLPPTIFEELKPLLDLPISEPDPVKVRKLRHRTGPSPEKTDAIKNRLRAAAQKGVDLAAIKQEELTAAYGAGAHRSTCIAARDDVLRELGLPIPRNRRR